MYTNNSASFYKPNLFYATRSSLGGGGRFAPEWCVNVIWHLTLTSIIAHIN